MFFKTSVRNIHRKSPVLESLFNKVVCLKARTPPRAPFCSKDFWSSSIVLADNFKNDFLQTGTEELQIGLLFISNAVTRQQAIHVL